MDKVLDVLLTQLSLVPMLKLNRPRPTNHIDSSLISPIEGTEALSPLTPITTVISFPRVYETDVLLYHRHPVLLYADPKEAKSKVSQFPVTLKIFTPDFIFPE